MPTADISINDIDELKSKLCDILMSEQYASLLKNSSSVFNDVGIFLSYASSALEQGKTTKDPKVSSELVGKAIEYIDAFQTLLNDPQVIPPSDTVKKVFTSRFRNEIDAVVISSNKIRTKLT